MYPYEIIFGMTLYDIFLASGIVAAIAIFAFFSRKFAFSAKLHNFILLAAVLAIVLGYGSAVLFQSFYNWLGGAEYELSKTTGATFLGGLVGGAAVFLSFYFGIGHFYFKDGEHVRKFGALTDVAAAAIPAAHALGRIGCLAAGCCHGGRTEAWYGIYHVLLGYKVVPVQLFEAIFLALLCAAVCLRIKREKRLNLPIYMIAYGFWRFFAEYLRADDRGGTIVSFFTPSQLTSLVLIVGGVAALLICGKYKKRRSETAKAAE